MKKNLTKTIEAGFSFLAKWSIIAWISLGFTFFIHCNDNKVKVDGGVKGMFKFGLNERCVFIPWLAIVNKGKPTITVLNYKLEVKFAQLNRFVTLNREYQGNEILNILVNKNVIQIVDSSRLQNIQDILIYNQNTSLSYGSNIDGVLVFSGEPNYLNFIPQIYKLTIYTLSHGDFELITDLSKLPKNHEGYSFIVNVYEERFGIKFVNVASREVL